MTFLLSLAIFRNWCFFWKNSSNFFFTKIKFWTFRENLLFLSHSTLKLLLLPILKLFLFFQKVHHFSGKKWTFWEIVIFAEKSHSTATLLSLAILKISCFFWKNSSSFPIKINFWTFWDFFLFLSHSTAKLLISAHFLNLETIFPHNHLCFAKPQNLNVLRSLTNSVAFYGKFATLSSL